MKLFSDLNIGTNRFEGKKIDIDDVLDVQIEVLNFKIEPSIYPKNGNGKRLTLSIKHENKLRVIFTGSLILQEQCLQVQELNGFPIKATIKAIKPRGFKFT